MAKEKVSSEIEKKDNELHVTGVDDSNKALLSESDFNFKSFIEQASNMIFINQAGKIVYMNAKCEEVMGYTRQEFLSPSFDFMKLIAPESVELVTNNFKLYLQGQDIKPNEYVLINRKGQKINAIITSKIIDYGGDMAILGIATDITYWKQTEKRLRDREKNYQKLITEMYNGFVLTKIIFSEDGRPIDCCFLDMNPAFEKICRLKKNDIVKKKIKDVFPGTESFWVDQCGDVAIKRKQVQFKNGLRLFKRYFEVVAYSPKEDEVALVFTDITERVQIEKALRESETNFRAVAENAHEGILIAIKQGDYVYGNRRASEITGYSIPKLLTMSYRDLVHPDELKRIGRIYKKHMDGKPVAHSYETLIQRKDNTIIPVEISGANILWKEQPATMIAIRNIILRKRFEDALGKINSELERRAKMRTTELIDTAKKLEENRRELFRKRLDLEKANKELVQTNNALSVLARNIDRKRDLLERKIGQTIGSRIMPLIKEIKSDKLPEKTHAKLDVLVGLLNDLTPSATKAHEIIISLSIMELRVAMMIRKGFSSEEIARLLNISPHTVKTHRKNIRRKLNLKNTNINLTSFLRLKFGKASAGAS
jgi:PAS domain S-box-containing protein